MHTHVILFTFILFIHDLKTCRNTCTTKCYWFDLPILLFWIPVLPKIINRTVTLKMKMICKWSTFKPTSHFLTSSIFAVWDTWSEIRPQLTEAFNVKATSIRESTTRHTGWWLSTSTLNPWAVTTGLMDFWTWTLVGVVVATAHPPVRNARARQLRLPAQEGDAV